MQGQHPPVRRGVRDEEDDELDASISAFQRASTVDGLCVTNARLRLNPDLDVTDPDEAVPRAQISRDRQRDLGADWHGSGQLAAEPFEDRELAGIKRRVAAWDSPDDQPKADGRTCSTGLIDRQRVEFSTLDATELRVGHPYAATGYLLARRG